MHPLHVIRGLTLPAGFAFGTGPAFFFLSTAPCSRTVLAALLRSTLGGNPYLLPGVEQAVTSFIKHNVLR